MSQASSPFNPQKMEAAGLAVGVVDLGLQLATTLQTYVEGVAGAEDRLRELSFDVASTASTLKQLEDMLNADKAVGRHDIYSLSRRCEKVYQGIVRVIVGASAPPSTKGKAIARNVGLSDLTATRLAHFGWNMKWPWVEPRVKACQEELRWLKMDLLLHLQVATVARIHLQQSPKQVVNLDDESTIEAVAERLIAQRAVCRKAALEGRRQRKSLVNAGKADVKSEPLLAASQKTARFEHEEKGLGNDQRGVQETQVSALATNLVQIPSFPGPGSLFRPAEDSRKGSSRSHVSDDTMKETTRGNTLVTSTRSLNLVDKENVSRDLNSTLPYGNSRPSSSHFGKVGMLLDRHTEAIKDEKDTDDPFDIEAWTLPLPGVEPRRLPFKREAIMQRIQLAAKNGDVSAWDQFLALTPEQRDQAQDLVAQSGKADARARSYLALETREDDIIVFVAVSQNEEVVYLTDPIARTWQFSYKDFENWPVAKQQICLLEAKDAHLQHEITDGHFDIRAEAGALIPPMLWHQFVKPGKRLEMAMWNKHVPLSSNSSSSSEPFFEKSALKRLFTFRRRRHAQEKPNIQPIHDGAFTPGYGVEYQVLRRAVSVSAILNPIGAAPDEELRPSPDDLVGHSEPSEVESTKAEVDDEDLFDWSDEEVEEELDTAETFSQLLARWTNVDATTS
ncbi:hypothetical protein MRS44_015830 [Fusarium solani]|uniref:uncharacterized protein n=1 Tax=Fusarium solani TaxID=169388 RepID=UPI0032C407D8|nr:hypothetical protein MRS44_015830 [Fusarium solani]